MLIKELYTLTKLLFSTRPSDHLGKDLEVLTMNHFPFKGYKWLMWCGRMISRADNAEKIQSEMQTKKFQVSMNHEKIHLMQAVACGDSWVKYYLRYLWEWLRRGFLAPMSANYYVNRYESEAYANEEDTGYCADYDGRNLRGKYSIRKAKKLYRQLGGTASAWKEYVKGL